MSTALREPERRLRAPEAVAMSLGLAACAYAIGAAAWVILRRWNYTYELEWTEGYMTEIVQRVMRGEAVYQAPSPDWMPLAYTPLYYLASAGLAVVRGLDPATLRLVSIFGACVALLALVWISMKMVGRWWAAPAAAGLLAAAFRPGGFWFDVARSDSLMLGLTCAGCAALYRAESTVRWAAGALLLTLAFWSKQPALFFLGAGAVLALRKGRGPALAYGAVTTLGVVGPLVALHLETAGWSTFCIFGLPDTAIGLANVRLLLLDNLLLTWWPVLILAAGGVFLAREERWFLGSLAAAGLAASFGGRLRLGGYDNVLLPLHASLVLLGVAGLAVWTRRSRHTQALAWTLLAVQVAWTAYSPRAQVPTERDKAFWDSFLLRIAGIHGEVLVPTTAFIQERVGKASNAMWLPVMELAERGRPQAAAFRRSLRERLASGRVGAVVLTDEGGAFGMDSLLERWRSVDMQLPGEGGYPVTGWRIRPRWLLLPPRQEVPGSRGVDPALRLLSAGPSSSRRRASLGGTRAAGP